MTINEKPKYAILYDYKIYPFNSEWHVFRVIALRDFANIKRGDIGGYIRSHEQLSHEGDCWVADDAIVQGGRVSGNARIYGNAHIVSNAVEVRGDARVGGNAVLMSNVRVEGSARIDGNACLDKASYVGGTAHLTGNVRMMQVTLIEGEYNKGYITDFRPHVHLIPRGP